MAETTKAIIRLKDRIIKINEWYEDDYNCWIHKANIKNLIKDPQEYKKLDNFIYIGKKDLDYLNLPELVYEE